VVIKTEKSLVMLCQRFHQFLESLNRQSTFSQSQVFIGAVQPPNFEWALMNQFSSGVDDATFEISDEYDR